MPWWITVPVTVAAALAVTQWLARGMTSPLREMTGAARAMAAGDYSQRVTASSSRRGRARSPSPSTPWPPTSPPPTRSGAGSWQRCPMSCGPPWPPSGRCWRTSSTGSSAPTTRRCVRRFGSPSGSVPSSPTCSTCARLDAGVAPLSRHRGAGRRPPRRRPSPESTIDLRPVQVRCETEPADLIVLADPARLAQLVVNLVDNAIRHSPPGQVLVSARVDRRIHLVARGPRRGPRHPRRGRRTGLRTLRLRRRRGWRHRPRAGHRPMGVPAARRHDHSPAQ